MNVCSMYLNSFAQKGPKSGISLERRRSETTAGYYQRNVSLNNLFTSKVNSLKLFLKIKDEAKQNKTKTDLGHHTQVIRKLQRLEKAKPRKKETKRTEELLQHIGLKCTYPDSQISYISITQALGTKPMAPFISPTHQPYLLYS